ncbi:MAG: ELWxxDGT repeat protein [Gemmataceae bacterium]
MWRCWKAAASRPAGPSASLVADVLPGAASSAPRDFANVSGALYFSAQDPTGGLGVYRSDGTAAGTKLLKNVGPLGAEARAYTALGSNVYFSAYGYLWKTDGTPKGTAQLALVGPQAITAMGVKMYFGASELWVSDGTAKGTKLLKDIDPTTHTVVDRGAGHGEPKTYQAPNNSDPAGFVVLNNTLLFAASEGTHGRDLWRSDGTAPGTTLVKDLPGAPEGLTVLGGAAYFAANGGLWRTDGTAAGTSLLRGIGFDGGISGLTVVGSTLYFRVATWPGGAELWKSDGTAAGTVPVANIDAANLTNVGGRLFFTGTDAAGGSEPWTSDGTAAGTVRVKDINPGGASSNPDSLTNVNGRLYFAADDGASGRELWQSDGTPAGTVMVRDIFPGATGSNPAYLVAMNSKLYFAATDPNHGRELWDPPPVPDGDLATLDFAPRSNATTGDLVEEFVARDGGQSVTGRVGSLGGEAARHSQRLHAERVARPGGEGRQRLVHQALGDDVGGDDVADGDGSRLQVQP